MIVLSKTYIDYRYANNDDIKENFTLSNLERDDKNVLIDNNANCRTKSFILAPYNSILSDDDESDNLDCENSELKMENDIIKFCAKVKEFNINYELNNNEEIDNGMLINSQSDINEELNNSKINDNPKSIYLNNNSINGNSTRTNSRKKNKNISETSSNFNNFSINDNFVKMVSNLGFKKDYVVKCLEKNELNQATAAYYLFLIILLSIVNKFFQVKFSFNSPLGAFL